MPIYEYSCLQTGEIVEVISTLNFADWKFIPCPIHTKYNEDGEEVNWHDAERIWSLPGNIQIGSPTKVFVNNKTGEIYTPFSKYDKPPIGYHEKELKGPIERSKFEKEQQRIVDAENQLTSHVLDNMKSESRKNRHDNLKARMNAIQREEFVNKEGKTETVEFTLSEKDKSLVKKAMERSKNKPRKEKKSDVKFAVNHYNPSNMDQMK